jgi:holo-[acyl-carrier protein] synthase
LIFGIGIDLVDVSRIRDSFARFGARFQKRIFTESEIAFCEPLPDKYLSYAARFAAKEAFSKALGTGLRGRIAWREIQVNDNERSRPTLTVSGRAKGLLENRPVLVSLSHTRGQATAIVIIEDEKKSR